jgi:hypothetical protein
MSRLAALLLIRSALAELAYRVATVALVLQHGSALPRRHRL